MAYDVGRGSNANREEISVYFNDEPSGEYGKDVHWNAPGERSGAQPSERTNSIKQVVNTGFAFNLGRSAVGIVSGRYGAYTGDYVTQNKLNNIMTAGGILASFGYSIATMNPLPALSMGVSLGMQAIDYSWQVKQADYRAGVLAQITNTSAISNSRGSGRKL